MNIYDFYPDQKKALTEIENFLKNPEQKVFILHGTANSGKSYIIPFIKEIAHNLGINETEVFASSSRVANNLFLGGGFEVNSIYSSIYGGNKSEDDEENKTESGNNDESDELESSQDSLMEKISIKNCENEGNALFIVDEAQLISDSFNQSNDIIFGTGYLLKDFLTFLDLTQTKRKVIFIGDPFQLRLGKINNYSLNSAYIEDSYKLKTNTCQLLDKPNFSKINKEVISCVNNIRTGCFNSFHLNLNEDINFLNENEYNEGIENIINNKIDGHILCYTNEEAQKVNCWIKKNIIKNGEDIAINDLVLFNNNILVEDKESPFIEPKKIYNGQFAAVASVSDDIITPIINKKGETTILKFREISLILDGSGHGVKILSLENFRLNPKAELSKNELLAYRIYLSGLAKDEIQNFENGKYNSDDELVNLLKELKIGKKVKVKVNRKIQSILRTMPSTKYYKFKNVALLRFGWAMTVHKSMSYKWKEVIFNVDQGSSRGKTNEDYFRWLYTGITRAKNKVSLLNYKPITPFDNTELIDNNSGIKPKDIFFISNNPNIEERLVELYNFIFNKFKQEDKVENQKLVESYGSLDKRAKSFILPFRSRIIERVDHLEWEERYYINLESTSEQPGYDEPVVLSFRYNGKGMFKTPTVIGSNNSSMEYFLTKIIKQKSMKFDFLIIKDEWRKTQYEQLSNILAKFQIKFDLIIQTNFKDKIHLSENENKLEIEVDYTGNGFFSKISAKYYTNVSIWNNFKDSINQIKS